MKGYWDLGLSSYSDYLFTPYWISLKKDLIEKNLLAKCWICEARKGLLLHHTRYDMLNKEKLNKSVFIICFDCHKQIHYRKVFFITFKTKLITRNILIRMKYLRLKYLVQNRRFIASVPLLFSWITS